MAGIHETPFSRIISIPASMSAESLAFLLDEAAPLVCREVGVHEIIVLADGNIHDPAIVLILKEFVQRIRSFDKRIILVSQGPLSRRIFSSLSFCGDVVCCDSLEQAKGMLRFSPAGGELHTFQNLKSG